MQFEPQTEEQLAQKRIAPEGEYDFEILEANEETSKKGNDMIKIVLGIYQGDAIRWRVTDYLMAQMEYKLRHCCDTVGLLAEYEKGQIDAMYFIGLTGKVKLRVKIDHTGQYQPKNEVADYIKRTADTKMVEPIAKIDNSGVPLGKDGLPVF